MNMGNNLVETLNVRIVGTGERIVVFAHGFGTDQSVWRRILPYFTPNYRIILYDLACAGTVNYDYFNFQRYTSLNSYADDLLNILNTLGVETCVYVGHSVSAMIGILASIRLPKLFTKLVLINASPWFLKNNEYNGGFEREEIEEVFKAIDTNYAAWVTGFAPLAVGGDLPKAIQEFSRTLFNMRPDISLFVCRTIFNSDLRDILGFVKVPCCIVQTAKDHSVPVEVAMYLKTHLGGRNTIEILRTEGNLPHLSAPMLLIPVLRRALSTT